MAIENKLPKGPSNSAKMGATPGTQLTAMQNVNTGANLNPNMPSAPQLGKQARSSYQQSIMPQGVRPGIPPVSPRPTKPVSKTPAQRTAIPSERIVSQGQALAPGTGYNIFSGMDASQINQMNQSMGVSNMTALPSLTPAVSKAPAVDPALAGFGLKPGQQLDMQLRSGEVDADTQAAMDKITESVAQSQEDFQKAVEAGNTFNVGGSDGTTVVYDPVTGQITTYSSSGVTTQSIDDVNTSSGDGAYNEWVKSKQEEWAQEGLGTPDDPNKMDTINPEQTVAKALADAQAEEMGISAEKKQELFDNLDVEYSVKLDQALAGIDRQMAMMGTFGSGAHMMNVNNALAQVLANMADEYNEINKIDIQVEETDFEQLFANSLAAAGFTEQQGVNAINELTAIDQNLISSMGEYITAYAPNDEVAAQLTGSLGKVVADGYSKVLDGEMSMGEFVHNANVEFAIIKSALVHYKEGPEAAKTFLNSELKDIANPMYTLPNPAEEFAKNTLMSAFGPVGKLFSIKNIAKGFSNMWKSIF